MRYGAKNFPHILNTFYGTPWLILPSKLAELHAVLWRRIEAGAPELVQAEQNRSKPLGALSSSSFLQGQNETVRTDSGYSIIGRVALIKIGGVISARASIFDEWSGGTSHEAIGRATDAAINDDKVEAIVYDIDSPGGVAYGMPENADKVLAARKAKPTTAVVNHIAASAAYWYASQAKEITITPAGMAGCIGVILRNVDETERLKLEGIKDILIHNTQSPYKTEGYPQIPFTEEARADLQRTADLLAGLFFDSVAKGRGLRRATIEKDFGQGRTLTGEETIAARMVDRIATLDAVINEYNAPKGRQARRAVNARMAELGLPIKGDS